ncbi:MAG: signal transduction histidine kinase [Nonlabens sp.]
MNIHPAPFIGALRVPWLRPLAQALRLLALSVGVVAAFDVGFTRIDIAVTVLLSGVLLWQQLFASLSVTRLRDVLVAETLLTGMIVVGTGGWSSAWLLAHMVPVGLAALGIAQSRALGMGLLSTALITAGTVGSWPEPRDLVSRASTLLLVVVFSAIARHILRDAAGPSDDSLGQVETLWHVRSLLEGLHTQVAGSRARFNIAEAVDAIRAGSGVLRRADVIAIFGLEDDGTLRTLHAVGLPAGRVRMQDLRDRVTAPSRDGAPRVLKIEDGGLGRDSIEGAYIWLPVPSDEPPHILVVESIEHLAADEVLAELARVGQPLAITISNAAWFSRVRHLGVDEERQRIAAQLHDQFAQSLAVVQLKLELALRRHPEDEGLIELKLHVKDSLGQLRDTMVELRATVNEDHSLADVLGSLVTRLADRHGVVAKLTLEGGGQRPMPAVEQQLLRVAQELTRRAVFERGAVAVSVRYVCDEQQLLLEVTDDGEAPTVAPRRDVADVIRERAEAIGATVEAARAGPGLSRVSVVTRRLSK